MEMEQNKIDFKFVEAIDDLMKSLPENVACRISSFQETDECPDIANKDEGGGSHDLGNHSSNEYKLQKENEHRVKNTEGLPKNNHDDTQLDENVTANNEGNVRQINQTLHVLTDVVSPYHSKDFDLKPLENDNYCSLGEQFQVNLSGKVDNPCFPNFQIQDASNENDKDGLIKNAIIQLSENYDLNAYLDQSAKITNHHKNSDFREVGTMEVNFVDLPKLHAGDGDCFIVPLNMTEQNNNESAKQLSDLKLNAYKIRCEELKHSPIMNYPHLQKKPIRVHWALTRISIYEDASTYEVMRPYKKAPKKSPKQTDKVFIVINDEIE